jgi:hypothetical protein
MYGYIEMSPIEVIESTQSWPPPLSIIALREVKDLQK